MGRECSVFLPFWVIAGLLVHAGQRLVGASCLYNLLMAGYAIGMEDKGRPLYQQLADWLLEQIQVGALPPGARAPSEHELARQFGVGRPTVRQATEQLVQRGILVRRRGAGTFVCEPRSAVDLFSWLGTRDAFSATGLDIQTELVSQPALVHVSAAPDNPFADRTALRVSRISRLGRSPVLLEHIFLHPQLFAALTGMDLSGESLSALVERQLHLRPSSADQRFMVKEARGKHARALGVAPGTPLLFVQRLIHFPQHENAVFVELYCRSDRMVFSQTIQGAPHA